jgi:chromosome segregation ATPase
MQDYANSLQKKLDELNSQLVQLQQQGQDLAGDAQQRWEDRLSALQEQRQELQKDLDELGDASGDVWRELKEGLDAAWADLKNATDQAAKEFE